MHEQEEDQLSLTQSSMDEAGETRDEKIAKLEEKIVKLEEENDQLRTTNDQLKTINDDLDDQSVQAVQLEADLEQSNSEKAQLERKLDDVEEFTFITNKAAEHFVEKKYDDCIELCEKAVIFGREKRINCKLIAFALAQIGNAYLKQGRLEDALHYFDESVSDFLDPQIVRIRQDVEKKVQERETAASQLGLDSVTSYNVAFIGQSGAGKSTLINYLCGYKDDQNGAAQTDVAECTQKIAKYVHPKINHLVLWDCPGAGTMANPIETYFEDKMLYAFDYLVIVFTERFKEIDATLIKKAIENEIPIAVVRNKANIDLMAMKKKPEFKNQPDKEVINKLIEKLRQDTTMSLIQCGDFAIPDTFIINSWALGDEDEPKFEEAQLLEYVTKMMIERRSKK